LSTEIWSSGWVSTGYETDQWGGTVHACTWVKLDSKNTSTRTATLTAYCDMNYTSSTGKSVWNTRGWDVHIETPGGTTNGSTYTQLNYGTSYAVSRTFTINYDSNGEASFSVHGWCDGPYDADGHMYSGTLTLSGSNGIGKAESAPPAPTNPSCKLSGDTNVVISWSHVGSSSSKPLTGFYIDKGEDNGVIQSGTINQNTNASQRSFTYTGAANKRYCFRIYAYGSGGMSAGVDTPNFVYTKPAAITSATDGMFYFYGSSTVFSISVKCDISDIAWPGTPQIQLGDSYGYYTDMPFTADTGSSNIAKYESKIDDLNSPDFLNLNNIYNGMTKNSTSTTLLKGRIRYANADNSAYSDWKEFTITTRKIEVPGSIYVETGGKAAYTYTKDSSGKITKITPNISVNIRDDSGKGAYTYTKDSNGKITKITPNIKMSMLV